MSGAVRKILILFLVFAAIYFAGNLVHALLNFSTEGLLDIYFLSWSLSQAFVQLMDAFIPLTATAVLLGFSFLFLQGSPERQSLTGFTRLASMLILLFLLMATVETVISEGFAPGIRAGLEELYGKSSFAEGSLREGKNSKIKGDYQKAILYFDYYLSINPDDEDVKELKADTKAAFDLAPKQQQTDNNSSGEYSGRLMNQSAGDLVRAAERFLNNRDYYSAHYYATIARQIEPGRRDASRIRAEAWNRIQESEFSREAQESGDFYRKKREAYTAFDQANYIKAYYLFHDLEKDAPMDQDIETFSLLVLEQLEQSAFFTDELEQIKALPGRHDIFFINKQGEIKEFIYFNRFIPLGVVAYAYGVEILGMDSGGKVAYHISAPAAKITESTDMITKETSVSLMLKALDREDRTNLLYEPVDLAVPDGGKPASLRALNTGISKIPGYSQIDSSLKLQYLHQLFALRPDFAAHGYHPGKIEIEIIMRVLKPFSLLILGFLALAAGWALRVRNRKKWYHFLLMPLIAAALFRLYGLYIYFSRIVYLYLLLQTGFLLTLVTAVLVQALLLGIALLLVARLETAGSN